jgi:hypothetical protein
MGFRLSNIRSIGPIVLACLSIVIGFIEVNITELFFIYRDVILYFSVLVVVTYSISLLLHRYFIPRVPLQVICNMAAVGILYIFLFYDIMSFFKDMEIHRLQLTLWTVGGGGLLWGVYRLSAYSISTFIISVFMFGFAFVPLINIVRFTSEVARTEVSTSSDEASVFSFANKPFKPNVYFLLPDMHIREDVVERFYKGSIKGFTSQLKDRGFYIADKSYSNQPTTGYSLSTTLSMEYIWLPEVPFTLAEASALGAVHSGDRLVMDIFRQSGYKYILAEGEMLESQCIGTEDYCFSGRRIILENFLLNTPLLRIYEHYGSYLQHSDYVHNPNEVVADALDLSAEPFFLFAHIHAPHPRFVYNSDCSTADVRGEVKIGNTYKHTDIDLWRSLYLNQMHCIDRQLVMAVDTIIDNDEDAIIIIQADHGSPAGILSSETIPFSQWSEDQFVEAFGILNAIRLPDHCQSNLYPELSPVNTFRLVFSCLSEKPIELLPDRSFHVLYDGTDDQLAPVIVEEWNIQK